MTKEQAMQTLTAVCQQYRGTIQEHNVIREALNFVNGLEEKKMENKTKPTKTIQNKIIHNGVTYTKEQFLAKYPELYDEYYKD